MNRDIQPRRSRRPAGAGKMRGQLTRVDGTLTALLQGLGLTVALQGWQAVSLWPEVVGSPASERSRAVAFESGCLIVEVESAVWMNQLSYFKRAYRDRLNRALGADIIREIQFTPRGAQGTSPGAPRG